MTVFPLRLTAAVLLVIASFLLAPGAGAQDDSIKPHEATWFERWGVTPSDRYEYDSIFVKSRAFERLDELIAAADSGDYVAWLIADLTLGKRCSDGKRVSRAHCQARAHWAKHHPDFRHRKILSESISRWGYVSGPDGDHDVDNYTEIGKLLELGIGGAPDYEAAAFFYEWIVALGHPDRVKAEPAYRLGLMAEHGRGSPPDIKKAMEWYRRAGNIGHPQAAFSNATYLLGQGSRDKATIDGHLDSAADGGIATAAFLRAYRLEKGQGHVFYRQSRDELIFRRYRQAAMAGHVGAMSGLARAYFNGWGTRENEGKAMEWWEKAARAGDGEAAYRLAVRYSKRGQHQASMPWLRRAAEAGVPGAADSYNQMRANGWEERSIKGTLLGVVSAIFDIQAEAAEQRRQEQLFEESVTRATLSALANERVANMSATSSNGSGRRVSGGIILRDDSEFQAKHREEQEALRRIAGQEDAAAATRASQATAERAAADAAVKRRRDAALIACYGSLEAARTARYTCQ